MADEPSAGAHGGGALQDGAHGHGIDGVSDDDAAGIGNALAASVSTSVSISEGQGTQILLTIRDGTVPQSRSGEMPLNGHRSIAPARWRA